MNAPVLSLAILAWTTLTVGAVQAATLIRPEDIPRLIRENNGTSHAAERSMAAAEARTGHLTRSYLPTLSVVGGGERFQTGTLSERSEPYGAAEVRMNLFRSGRDGIEERARRAQYEAAEARKGLNDAELISQARKLYWKLVAEREAATAFREALAANDRSLKAAVRRISRGVTTDTDRLEFQIHGGELKEEIESIEHEALITSIRLRAVLGLPESENILTAETLAHVHDEEVLKAQATGNLAIVRNSVAGEHSAKSIADQAERYWTPSIDAYGGYYLHTQREKEHPRARDRDEYAVGLRLTMTLWDGGQSQAQAASLRLQADAAAADATQNRRDVEASVRASQEEMKHAHDLIHGIEERIEQGAKYVSRTMSEYDRGVKNSPDALGALQKQLGYRKRLIDIKLDYQLAKANLLQSLGK